MSIFTFVRILKIILRWLIAVAGYLFIAPFLGVYFAHFFERLAVGYFSYDHMFPSLIPGFFIFNSGVAYLCIRWKHGVHSVFALLAASLSSALVHHVLKNGLYPARDAYGMLTAVLINAVISLSILAVFCLMKHLRQKGADIGGTV